MNLKFTWDGSDVTETMEKTVRVEFKEDKNVYWRILFKDGTYLYCQVLNRKNALPIIIDELKPTFGLTKMGTHWIKVGKMIKMLIKVDLDSEKNIESIITLNKCDMEFKKNFIRQVQEIFTFKELLGIPKIYESSIRVIQKYKYSYPISSNEPYMRPENPSSVVSGTMIDKWFVGTSVEEVTKRITHVTKYADIPERIFELRNQIQNTIERIDRDSITYSDYIIENILSRLQSCF